MNDDKGSSTNESFKKKLFNTPDDSALGNGFFSEKLDPGKTQLSIPEISLPKGGGAIKGIDEKFEVNASNGTASFSIALPITPGRSGFQPSLSLHYNSGAGNSAFGLGWNIDLPSIQRRTDKKLPEYKDEEESDVFMFTGAEDLQPFLVEKEQGVWKAEIRNEGSYTIKRYRPRVEGKFSRLERIVHPGKGMYWKVTTQDNIVTFFGYDSNSRLADPANPRKIFKWLPCLQYNDKGDWMRFIYKAETTENVPCSLPEKNRLNGKALFTNRYLQKVEYGNRSPFYPPVPENLYDPGCDTACPHFFDVVFDYGDRSEAPWECRIDPFSDYHAGFEIRTYRLCRRILMYHSFEELGNEPVLVKSLDLQHQTHLSSHPELPQEITYLGSITQSGYARAGDKLLKKSLPPMEFGYQELKWDLSVKTITPDNIVNAPAGLTNNYQWMDLYGEGISGILTEQGGAWYYKHNLGDGSFTYAQQVAPKPSFNGLSNGALQLVDLNANGYRQLVSMEHGREGYFTLLDDNEWDVYRPFETVPEINLKDPFLRMLDLDGDGRPDILITEESIFRWYPSLGTKGYAPLEIVSLDMDEEKSPRIVFADPEQTIFLADMSGDGLTDIVRIRNGSVCYWPNKGYGRFGAKIEMANAPWFDSPDLFNPDYIYLTDISGTGATDILYLGKESFRAWLNFSGNAWSPECRIDPFFSTAQPDKISVLDLLGNGTACIAWSSPLPSNAHAPMKYIDLMGGRKPHVMIFHSNHCGSETRLTYVSSTHFYLKDKKDGHPWITKLPFPVQCVSKKEVWEKVSATYFVNEYSYHHGYYDHAEREFRGFGRVDQTDTQQFETGRFSHYSNHCNADLNQAPVLTRTWFHLGAYLHNKKILHHFRHEYWYNNPLPAGECNEIREIEYVLPDARFIGRFNDQELREAHRACKGMMLRQEIFALDGSAKEALPYTVAEHNCYIRKLQPLDGNRYAVFMVHESEAINFSYEREIRDPRVAHTLNIRIDDIGNVLKSVSVVYPRKQRPPELKDDTTWQEQNRQYLLLTENKFTPDIITADTYRLRVIFDTKSYETAGIFPSCGKEYFHIADLDIPIPEISHEMEFQPGLAEKRLIDHIKKIYLSDDMSHPMPEGEMDALGLIYEGYQMVVSNAHIEKVFVRDGQPLIGDIGKAMDDAKYIDLEKNGRWWTRSGRMIYENAGTARAMFYQPRAYEDAFGARTTVKYHKEDRQGTIPYWMLVDETIDAPGNTVKALRFNFRNLSAELVRDVNHNLSEAVFDELGVVVATAVRGKENEAVGDVIDATVRPFLSSAEIQSFFDDPFSPGADPAEKGRLLLGHATTRILYDYSTIPVKTATIARETHLSGLAPGQESRLQYGFEYSGGTGNSVLKKAQAPPGPAWGKDEEGHYTWKEHAAHRWIGNGRTVLNNKGKPVKQYEPYFSASHDCEKEDVFSPHGVSPVMHYDPIGRVIRTDLPNGTFTETRFDNWRQDIYDSNDTVLRSRWYRERINGNLDNPGMDPRLEKMAAEKAAVHAETFSTVYLDSLGRAVTSVTRNKWQSTRLLDGGAENNITRIEMDIKGNMLSVSDARANTVVKYKYDLRGQILLLSSMDANNRWTLNDSAGKTVYTWDSRGQRFYTTYDLLRRPVAMKVHTNYYSAAGNAGHAEAKEITFAKIFYGNNEADAIASNLNGVAICYYDTAGLKKTVLADFKGNVLNSSRQLCNSYIDTPDWSEATAASPALPMSGEVFTNLAEYDALNRLIKIFTPHTAVEKADVIVPSYNETNLLNALQLRQGGAGEFSAFIKQVLYDEKGQRVKISYGNNITSKYTYDKETFRLLQLQTRSHSAGAGELLQLLSYTYDPSGNITHTRDKAFQPVYFKNKVVEPGNDYTYDALYRLIAASGREFGPQNSPVTQYDGERTIKGGVPFQNSNEIERYTQCYAYDAVGNMMKMLHVPVSGNGWNRDFLYSPDSNRMKATKINSENAWERYHYDPHGNMLNLDAINTMYWDCQDRFGSAHLSGSHDPTSGQQAWYTYDGSGHRMRKVVKKQNRIEERIYVGPIEFYREYESGQVDEHPVKEVKSLHIMDKDRRVALVETVTIAGPREEQTPCLTRYQHANFIGSSSMETDEGGRIIGYEEYYPFGSTSFQLTNKNIQSAAKRYRFTGMERDEETGLNYHSARYYMPWLARWTSSDPINIGGGINLYAYCSNNPIVNKDDSGTEWCGVTDGFFGLFDSDCHIAPEVSGSLKAVGGGLETLAGGAMILAGGATCEFGVGCFVLAGGVLVAGHGIDTAQSGVRTAIAGEQVDSFTSEGLQWAGMTKGQANVTDAVFSIVGSFGAGAVTRAPAVATTAIDLEQASVTVSHAAGAPSVGTVANPFGYAIGHTRVGVTLGDGTATVWSHLTVPGAPTMMSSGALVESGEAVINTGTSLAPKFASLSTVPVTTAQAEAALAAMRSAAPLVSGTEGVTQGSFGAYSLFANDCASYGQSILNTAGVSASGATPATLFISTALRSEAPVSTLLTSATVMQPVSMAGMLTNATVGGISLTTPSTDTQNSSSAQAQSCQPDPDVTDYSAMVCR